MTTGDYKNIISSKRSSEYPRTATEDILYKTMYASCVTGEVV